VTLATTQHWTFFKDIFLSEEEKDLGVLITREFKFHEQCVQSVKKAQSVLGMVKRHFKVIDKDDFMALYKTYIRPHWSTASRHGRHT